MDPERPPRPRRRRPIARRGRNPLVVWGSVAAAVVVAAAVTLAVVHFVKSRRGDPRLIGTWQSDADATIADIRKNRPVTEKQEQAMRKLFGKMKLTYTATTITTDFEGTLDTQPYQVISKDGDWIEIKSWSSLSKKDEVFRIRFEGSDAYWVDAPEFSLSERFRRVR